VRQDQQAISHATQKGEKSIDRNEKTMRGQTLGGKPGRLTVEAEVGLSVRSIEACNKTKCRKNNS